MNYFDELCRSMEWLGQQDDTIFLGQAVQYDGTGMTKTLSNVPYNKKIELPVFEDTQMGICNGLAIAGKIPISIFPRWNFLLLATNQIVNHLDKIPIISNYSTKVIIRTAIGSINPLHPQIQHVGDFTDSFKGLLSNIEIIRLDNITDIFPAYQKAYMRTDNKSTIIVEIPDNYQQIC